MTGSLLFHSSTTGRMIDRPIYNSNLNGASFAQDGTKSTGGISCCGCGREGVTLAQCANAKCVKKYKAKQDRKLSATPQYGTS
jgi:hypothetical protein